MYVYLYIPLSLYTFSYMLHFGAMYIYSSQCIFIHFSPTTNRARVSIVLWSGPMLGPYGTGRHSTYRSPMRRGRGVRYRTGRTYWDRESTGSPSSTRTPNTHRPPGGTRPPDLGVLGPWVAWAGAQSGGAPSVYSSHINFLKKPRILLTSLQLVRSGQPVLY